MMKKQSLRLFFFSFLLVCLVTGLFGVARVPGTVEAAPQQASALDVVINEIAWAGTSSTTPADEWIELYNNTVLPIDITGWTLIAGSTTPSITLSGTIPANGYFLLERSDDTAVSVPADQTFTGGIANNPGGDSLELRDNLNNLVDTANIGGGTWPGGTAGTGTIIYASMERVNSLIMDIDANWGTNNGVIRNGLDVNNNPVNGTPKQQNSISFADEVIISEVAWAGTQAFSGDEWIELHNPGSSAVDLAGWRLEAADGEPSIALSGTLVAGGFLVLERGDDNVISDVTSPASLVYNSGLLSDSGEILSLRSPDRSVIDTANVDGGSWPAGSTSGSMERVIDGGVVWADTASGWITNVNTITWTKHDAANNLVRGTPGNDNWAFTVTPTLTPTITLTATSTSTSTPTSTPTPTSTVTPAGFLTIVINEVAWAGTKASTADEWIELYNPGATAVNLSGWILKALDGTPNIALTGTIPGGGYFLLERTDNNTVSDIVADQIFSGDLANSYETLQLFDPSNRQIDIANSNGAAWPAGSSSTYGSMERRAVIADSDTAWITNTGVKKNGLDGNGDPILGTPKQSNWALTVTATASPIPTATKTPYVYKTSTPVPPPPPPLVAINEFVPRPGHDWNNDGEINTGDEYIELINHGVINVSLSGYKLDDEANIGSSPYNLPAVTLKPGERIVFYSDKTGLLLSDGGDGVRLLKPNGQLMDAYNYATVGYPDQAYCRLPDNGGADDWNTECYPTPGLRNARGSFGVSPGVTVDGSLCPFSDIAPYDFVFAECDPFGNNIWRPAFWDDPGWLNGQSLPDIYSKWELFAD